MQPCNFFTHQPKNMVFLNFNYYKLVLALPPVIVLFHLIYFFSLKKKKKKNDLAIYVMV